LRGEAKAKQLSADKQRVKRYEGHDGVPLGISGDGAREMVGGGHFAVNGQFSRVG
jgi:hypothetical protein